MACSSPWRRSDSSSAGVEPPAAGPAGGVAGRLVCGAGLAAARGQQLVEVGRARVDVDLQRLVCAQLPEQALERAGGAGALGGRHQQRVGRLHAEDPHQRALGGHDQAGPVDRLHGEQIAGLGQRPAASEDVAERDGAPAGQACGRRAHAHRLSRSSGSACRSPGTGAGVRAHDVAADARRRRPAGSARRVAASARSRPAGPRGRTRSGWPRTPPPPARRRCRRR